MLEPGSRPGRLTWRNAWRRSRKWGVRSNLLSGEGDVAIKLKTRITSCSCVWLLLSALRLSKGSIHGGLGSDVRVRVDDAANPGPFSNLDDPWDGRLVHNDKDHLGMLDQWGSYSCWDELTDVAHRSSRASNCADGLVLPGTDSTAEPFIASDVLHGAKLGYVFKKSAYGLGYHVDAPGDASIVDEPPTSRKRELPEYIADHFIPPGTHDIYSQNRWIIHLSNLIVDEALQ